MNRIPFKKYLKSTDFIDIIDIIHLQQPVAEFGKLLASKKLVLYKPQERDEGVRDAGICRHWSPMG